MTRSGNQSGASSVRVTSNDATATKVTDYAAVSDVTVAEAADTATFTITRSGNVSGAASAWPRVR